MERELDDENRMNVAELLDPDNAARIVREIAKVEKDSHFAFGPLSERLMRGILQAAAKAVPPPWTVIESDRLLPSVLRDVDGIEDERRGTISVFDGPEPAVVVSATQAEEIAAVRAFVESAMSDGIVPTEIGIFVRTPALVKRAKSSVLGLAGADGITVNIMHLAKGLEFRAVAVMACDEGILPLDSRIEDAADDAEMDDIYETERRLLYVACTRARDRLMVSGVEPASEYLTDLAADR